MATEEVRIVAFGPLAEQLAAKQIQCAYLKGQPIRYYVQQIGATQWLQMGLTVALNGQVCQIQEIPLAGDEIALLPPVSGG